MRRLRDFPIRRKLVLLIMLTTVGALALATVGLVGAEVLRSRRDLARDLETLADVIADNTSAALAFQSHKAATETLASLHAKPSVSIGAVYDAGGALFATYRRDEVSPTASELPHRAPPQGTFFSRGALRLVRPIVLDGAVVGSVYLESDLRQMASRLRLQTSTVGVVFLLSALAALLLSSFLQRVISRPVLDLADTARAVSERRDYSLRASRQSADELGQLVDAFNEMLAQIQSRDSELRRAQSALESRVAERTAALEQELAERRRAERELEERNEELARSNQELDRSNRELDDFAYIASHDLKEPLRGIHNFSAFLLEDYAERLEEDGKHKLETLTRLARRMETLIDSLLHFSRVGRLDLAVDQVDLNTIVAEVVDSLAIGLAASGAEVRVPRPLPVVSCDRARVGEIFSNLIVNGIKYNDKPEKWVEVGTTDGAGPDGTPLHGENGAALHRENSVPIIFYIRDNGIGIPPRHFDAIFRIFKRLHGRDQYGGGTGAGLTIVKKIVERHQGHIWLDSTPGLGTTFYFTLEKGAAS